MPRFLLLLTALTASICASLVQAADVPAPADADLSSRILTPPPPASPRINGPTIYGQRPGRPFLYHIPATGTRPMRFAVDGLPPGLKLDEKTGQLTGKIDAPGEFQTTLRATNPAGGIEGGITNGEEIRVRVYVKPLSTLPKALHSVDLKSKEEFQAQVERTDVSAIAAAGVVGEAMMAFVLAEAVLEKFGGDSLKEITRNYRGYLRQLEEY